MDLKKELLKLKILLLRFINTIGIKTLNDIDATNIGAGKIVKVKADGINHEYVNDEIGTDEKVKYNSTDPTAGYLSTKIIAGAGILLEEGAGVDENKLKIDSATQEHTNTKHITDLVGEAGVIDAMTEKSDIVDNDKGVLEDSEVAGSPARMFQFKTLWNYIQDKADLVYEVSGALAGHLVDFAHGDIAHSNRAALDNVSGTNTGDQDLSGFKDKPNQITITSSATPTPTGSYQENELYITAQAEDPTIAVPTGTAANGNTLVIRIKDDNTARAITWNAIYYGFSVALPNTTILGKYMYINFVYNSQNSKWDLVSVTNEI